MMLLQSIRELKQLGIDIIFEENHIHALHGEGSWCWPFWDRLLKKNANQLVKTLSGRCKKL